MSKIIRIKNIAISFLGSIAEWYEFVVYAFSAPFIAVHFFPSHDPMISIIETFGAFAGGFLVRPLGGLVFGYFGDKYSRNKTMAVAVILIGLPTLLIGLMPTYETLGVLAPTLLILARLAQGVSVGGQFTGSAVFIREHIGNKHKYLGAGITFSGAFFGMLLASAVGMLLNNLLTQNQLMQFGWRIPFLLGIFVTLFGLYMKIKTSEPPHFKELKKEHRLDSNPIRAAFATQKMNMLITFFICWLTPLIVYQLFIYMPTYASSILHLPLSIALKSNTIAMTILAILTILGGYLADKLGYQKVMFSASLGLIIFAYPLYHLLVLHPNLLLPIQLMFALLSAGFMGPVMAVLSDLFAEQERYTALSFSYNLGFGIFGGTSALLNIIFIEKTKILAFPGIYLTLAAFVSLIALMLVSCNFKDKKAIPMVDNLSLIDI
jgi:MHS family proline/betaine transporter-like MFS transporter